MALIEYQNKIRGFKGADNLNAKIVKAIRAYREECGKQYPKLVCNTTISKYNVEIMEKIPEYAMEMGFDAVAYEYAGEMDDNIISNSLIDGLKPTPMFVQQNGQSILASKEQAKVIKRKLKEVRRKYRRYASFDVDTMNIDDLSEKQLYQGTIPHKKCYVERVEVTIDPYGYIVSCPIIHNYRYGNLLEDDFKDIWNNERHQRFRQLQNCGELPMCKHCILGVVRNPTFFRSLKRNFVASGINAVYHYIATRKEKRNGGLQAPTHQNGASSVVPETDSEPLHVIPESEV